MLHECRVDMSKSNYLRHIHEVKSNGCTALTQQGGEELPHPQHVTVVSLQADVTLKELFIEARTPFRL